MFRYLPWQTDRLTYVLKAIGLVSLLEATRTSFFLGLWSFYSVGYLQLAPTQASLAFSIHQLSDVLLRGVGGYLSQKLPMHLLFLFSSLITSLTLLAFFLKPPLIALYALSALWGFSLSFLYPSLMHLALSFAKPQKEARALSFAFLLTQPLSGVFTILIGQITQNSYWLTWVLLWGINAGIILLSLTIPRKGISLPKQVSVPGFSLWAKLFSFSKILPLAFGQTFAPGLVSLFLLHFAKEELKLEPLQLGIAVLSGGSVAVSLLPFTGRLVDQKGYRTPLVAGLGLIGLALGWLPFVASLTEAILLALIAGVGFSLFIPGWNGFLAKNLPQENRAAIWGTLMTVEGLGVALGPVAGGALWEKFGPQMPFLAGATILLSLSATYAILVREKR